MRNFLARFIALLLTVMPWMATLLSVPRPEKPQAALSNPHQPESPQLSNAAPTPGFNSFARDLDLPPGLPGQHRLAWPKAASSPRAPRPEWRQKLFLTYSRWQLDGG